MVKRDASVLKTERIALIKREISKNIAKGISTDRLLDWIELNIGLSRSRAQQYIDLICRAEGWIELDGKIISHL